MHFGTPLLLVLLLALVPVGLALAALARWRRAAARRLVLGGGERVSPWRRALKAGLVLAALACIAVAAARPQRGSKRLLLPREGTDVMIALDVSISMLTPDVEPNRFDRAKAILGGLLDRLQGDRVGLVVFAGTAGVRFPLTIDTPAARELIQSAAIKEGGLAAGTGIGDGIRVAAGAFPQGDQTRSKVLLIVSDGEDLGGSPQDAVRMARDRGITISTLGIGTEAGGPVTRPNPAGTPGRRPTAEPPPGEPATSRRDEAVLRQLATTGRGRYFDGNAADPAADVAEEIGRLERTRFESQEGTIPVERYQWLAAAALLLLTAEFLLPDIVRHRRASGAESPRRLRRGRTEAA